MYIRAFYYPLGTCVQASAHLEHALVCKDDTERKQHARDALEKLQSIKALPDTSKKEKAAGVCALLEFKAKLCLGDENITKLLQV